MHRHRQASWPRKLGVEAKVSLERLGSYAGIPTMLGVAGIYVKWLHDAAFPTTDFVTFALASYGVLVVVIAAVLVIDRLVIWPGQLGVNAHVAPLTLTEAFRSAKHLAELEADGVDAHSIEADLRERFRRAGLEDRFLEYLEVCRR